LGLLCVAAVRKGPRYSFAGSPTVACGAITEVVRVLRTRVG
jgi:hypothetical protein